MAQTLIEQHGLFGCVQCGRCVAGCPISIRTALNTRKLIYQSLLESKKRVQSPDIWCCTTCKTCSDRCPKGVEIMEYIVALRRYQVERGKIEPTARNALESILKHGNPWERAREKRTEWITDDLDVRILEEGESTDVLLFVGCTPAYDPEAQKSARALAKLLNKAGVDFAILGTAESCCGNEVERMGEEGLFEMLVEENTELFSKYKFNRIVTISPHCYNTFKNEYTALDFEIIHYTQLLQELIESGALKFDGKIGENVIFHDPCFLGKQNAVFDPPRFVLQSALENELLEFDRNRERSQCCEGGGGRMWIEVESDIERTAEERVKDAEYFGAEIIATSCPFCMLTLSDAVKTTGLEDKLRVIDISEILIIDY
ncbi:hypothetical protein DRQ36_02425 [bacterium]|nr:MAG: hypothetical protein DRQ36_02425 [bacterium]